VNPIKELFSKRKSRDPIPSMHEIDPDILAKMPLEIQREYAMASTERNDAQTASPPEVVNICQSDSLGSQVDMGVFNDLPADIQHELRQQYLQQTTTVTSSPFISASQLDSKSLLDKTVLDELPVKLQREVRAIIRLNRINKKNEERASPLKRKADVLVVDSPKCELAYDNLPNRSQIDREVYDSLPLEIQNDINAELRKRKIDPPPRIEVDIDSFAKPSLDDAHDIKDVLKHLDNWLTMPIIEYSRDRFRKVSPPSQKDVKEITRYLEGMVEGMFLSETRILLGRCDGGIDVMRDGEDEWVFEEWVEMWKGVKGVVEGCIERKYGGRLKPRK
jgi:hypothetical protein